MIVLGIFLFLLVHVGFFWIGASWYARSTERFVDMSESSKAALLRKH